MTPIAIKLLDSQFHHHDHYICTVKNEHHIHIHHDICPIPGFEFSLYTLNKIIIETQKTFYQEDIYIKYVSNYFCDKSEYSFLLRAPPRLTSNT